MCKVKVLIIGDSEWRNLNASRIIEEKLSKESDEKAEVIFDLVATSTPEGKSHITSKRPDDYDVIAADNSVMECKFWMNLIGADVPVVLFSDLWCEPDCGHKKSSERNVISIATHAIAQGDLRDKILSVTEQIEETSRLIAAIA